MGTSASRPNRAPRRRLRFGLRTLLLVVTGGCVVLALWVAPAERQRRAVAAIRQAGGYVRYDFEEARAKAPSPAWLSGLVGLDYIAHPVRVELNFGSDNAETLQAVAQLTSVESLRFYEVSLQPGATDPLKSLRGLQTLSIWESEFSHRDGAFLEHLPELRSFSLISNWQSTESFGDAGLSHLRNAPQLEEVYLLAGGITAAGLAHLSGAKRLRRLNISGNSITAVGLRHLADLPDLQTLNISYADIDDEALRILATFATLQELRIAGTAITDAGLAHLATFDRLEVLNLSETQITDAAIPALAKLRSLKSLILVEQIDDHHASEVEWTETAITPAGFRELNRALPGCTVEYRH